MTLQRDVILNCEIATFGEKVIYFSDDTDSKYTGEPMRFVLTYEGPLKASNNRHEKALASHKQEIRKHFHKQLKELWKNSEMLNSLTVCVNCGVTCNPIHKTGWGFACENRQNLDEYLSEQFCANNYCYVPFVCEEYKVLCSLDILFLRRDVPGSIIQAGDLDNRIKTLVDALRKPSQLNELGKYTEPEEGETPFHCLLEDDKLISSFSVKTETLLDPVDVKSKDRNEIDKATKSVKLVVKVEIKPYLPSTFNLSFA